MRLWLGRFAIAFAGLAAILAALCSWQWVGSSTYSIRSNALGEVRTYRVFNRSSNGRMVYALDGHSLRNGLAPAVILSVSEFFRGEPLPTIVAIDSNASRDRDFRPRKVEPTYWRPDIGGRSEKFDAFLLEELAGVIEAKVGVGRSRYLVGHSLSGFYALDLASREPHAFDGFLAFAPTFSHDTTIAQRLPLSCNAGFVYANWGLESARDTEVWETVKQEWRSDRRCKSKQPIMVRHYASLHQSIMLTGQLHLALRGWE